MSARCADAIRRYQGADVRRRADGVCRFDPTCSQYALEAFEHRHFLVAVAMTVSRLLRCNPLVRRMTSDPVHRPRRTARPGTVRSLSLLSLLAGVVAIFALSGTAAADPPTGGCTGSANGRPAAEITRGDPLKVRAGGTVAAEGTTPPGRSGPNQTSIKVFLVDPIGGVTSEERSGDGDTWSSSRIEVDDYLKYGVGTYKVEVTNRGAGWTCTFVGYVELEGNPLTKPVGIAAAGLTAVGAAGGLLAPRKKPTAAWANDQARGMAAKRNPMDTILEEGDKVIAAADGPPRAAAPDSLSEDIVLTEDDDFALRMCLGCVVSMILVPAWAMPITGTGGGAGAFRVQARPTGPIRWKQRVWRRGRPVVGFISGLLFGLGASVLLWQYDVWLLNVVTTIVVPVVLGVLFGAYAWIGKPYQLVAVSADAPPPPATGGDPAPAAEEPPPPAPVPVDGDPPPPPPPVEDVPPPPAPVPVDDDPPPPPPPVEDVPPALPPSPVVDDEPPPPPPAV